MVALRQSFDPQTPNHPVSSNRLNVKSLMYIALLTAFADLGLHLHHGIKMLTGMMKDCMASSNDHKKQETLIAAGQLF